MSFDSAPGRWLLAVAVLGSGIAFLDATVVNVALPDIGRDLHASTSTLQWILNGYTLTLASLILLGGSLGDRYGRRRVFVFGTGLFTIASLLCAVAPNAELLVAARLVQGVGGALLTPGSLAMVESGFRPADRARAIGAWSGLGAVAGALGPLVGGVLVAAVSWRAVFLINLPLGIFIVVMAGRHVPETRDPAAGGRLDFRGVILAAVGLAGTTYALIEAPAHGASPLVLAMAIGGGLALIAFLARRAAFRQPDDAALDLLLAPIQRRQRGDVRRLRSAQRSVLPARGVLANLARLLAARGRCRLAADHRPDAAPLPRCGSPCPTDRAEDPVDRGTAGHGCWDWS